MRASIPACSAALLIAVPLLAATVTVDDATRYQVIDGWGACLYSGTPYTNNTWRLAYRDLGCNVLRMPLSKEVLRHTSGDMRIAVPLVDNLQSNVEKMSFNAMAMYGSFGTWLATNALEPERFKLVGSLWTPPHWMKSSTGITQYYVGRPSVGYWPTPWMSGDHNNWQGPGKGDSIGGHLRQDATNLTQFGRYVAAWVTGFRQRYGIPVFAVSLQNECSFENPFDSCTYERGEGAVGSPGAAGQWWQYAAALKAIKDEFVANNITTKIKAPHCAGVKDTPANPWELNQQMKYIEAIKLHSDASLINFVDYYCCNGYVGSSEDAVKTQAGYWLGKGSVPASWAFWLYAPGIVNDGKRTWFSECGGEAAAWANGSGGSPGSGAIVLAQKMHNALVHANVSAYIHWQMTDGSSGETEHTLLGTSHINNPHASKKYCAYKQFSRYVRPGAQRVKAVFGNGKTSTGGASEYDTYRGLSVSAYIHTQDLAATYVLVNMTASNQPVSIQLATAVSPPSYQVYRTSGSDSFARQADLTPIDNVVSLTMPAYSVVTVYGFVPEPGSVVSAAMLLTLMGRRFGRT